MRNGVKIIGWVALLSLFAADLGNRATEYFGHLYYPSPSGGKGHGNQQAATSYEHPDSQNAQRNAQEASPINRQQAPDQRAVAPKAETHGEWYASPDWWVAIFTGLLVIATAGLWVFTALLWKTTIRAVKGEEVAIATAREGNQISRDSIAAGQRAWLRPEVRITSVRYTHEKRGPFRISGALDIFFTVTVENLGNSPAIRVVLGKRQIIDIVLEMEDIADVPGEQTTLGEEIKANRSREDEVVIFPGEKREMRSALSLSTHRYDEIIAKFDAADASAAEKAMDDGKEPQAVYRQISPIFVGCVDYRFQSSGDHHQTWFAYEVMTNDGHAIDLDDLFEGETPCDRFMLRRSWLSVQHAD